MSQESEMSSSEDPLVKEFSLFLKRHKVYEALPRSCKVLLFDTRLRVKEAFFALVSNDVRAATLWDGREQRFVGMLTITDFINIIHRYYRSPLVQMHGLEQHRIETWREDYLNNSDEPLISVSPEASLFEAAYLLLKFKIHRLPVICESGSVLHVLTHKRILKFLGLFLQKLGRPKFLEKSVMDLKIGTFSNLALVKDSDSLYSALTLFVQRRVSALPVVDQQGRVVGLYSRFDVINLAAQKSYNDLEVEMSEALRRRTCYVEGVVKCFPHETLDTIIQRIIEKEVHRLVLVDDSDQLLGIVSLSDLLQALILTPAGITSLLQ